MRNNISAHSLSYKASATFSLIVALASLSGMAQQSADGAGVIASGRPSSPMHLTLPDAVQMALQHNRHLLLARDNVRDSTEQKRIAQSHFYPAIKNQSAILHITELEGVTIPAGAIGQDTATGLLPAHSLVIGQGGDTSYTSGTELAQPISQIFRIRAGVRAADADLRSARIQSGDADNAIALEVHQLYYGLLIEGMRAAAAQDAVEAAAITDQENARSVEDGKLLPDVELASRADLLDKRQALLVSRLNTDDLTKRLDDAVGLPLETKLSLDSDDTFASPLLPTRENAIALALNSNPTVSEARQAVAKARAGVDASRDAYIPDITGLARYSYQSGVPFFAHNFGTFGAAVSYDLFDGGAREARLRDSRIKLNMALTQLQQAENDIRIQLSAAYDKAEQIKEMLNVAVEATAAHEESFRIQSERAEANAALASSVAVARTGLSTARLNVLNARLGLYLAQNDIKRLLGQLPD